MDFFQNQDVARKKTSTLVFLFLLAVVLIICSIYLAVAFLFRYAGHNPHTQGPRTLAMLWDPSLFGGVAAGISALIGGGSLFKIASLAQGGHTVAELLGGQLVPSGTSDPAERRLLNVVEEMAIAAGTPVPPVYVLPNEPGINAFAAGNTTSDAVVAVTRGTIQHLSRDELQGVIGHEFSHILNGDMRLNIRLMGVLFGILLIGLTGWVMLRSQMYVSYRPSSSDDDDRKGVNVILVLGIVLFILGYVGVFFANLIKAAISRQREYLADASSVQFTRNPDGIAGASKKIGALAEGSMIREPHAEEASHMFFSTGVGAVATLFGLLDTHPPLVDRIRRIDPSFDGDFSKVRIIDPTDTDVAPALAARSSRPQPATVPFDPRAVVSGIGTVGVQQLAYATSLREAMPPTIKDHVRDGLGAQATIFALLLDRDDEAVRQAQLNWLDTHTPPALASETRRVLPEVQTLAPEARLPLAEMAVPALRQMSAGQYDDFLRNVETLIHADQQTSLFEYALERLLLRHLAVHFQRSVPPRIRYTTAAPLVAPIGLVLSALARVGQSEPNDVARAFAAGVQALGWPMLRPDQPPGPMPALKSLDDALNQLADASPQLKKQILTACAACVAADGQVTIHEGELLRAVADSMGCPMPPIMTQ